MKRYFLLLLAAGIGCSEGGGEGENGANSLPATPLASAIGISEVSAYQTLKATLMKDGAEVTPDVPIIQGKPLLVRVFLTPAADFQSREIAVRLALSSVKTPLEVRQVVSAAPQEAKLESTVNFELTAEQVTADLAWNVSVHEVSMEAGPGAVLDNVKYPADGTVPLATNDTGESIKVMIVPVEYNADGSKRLPDTSEKQMDKFRARMMALYPTRKVDLEITAPYPWTNVIYPSGQGWGRLLQSIIRMRRNDGAAPNVFYYGLFQPARTAEEFCGGGCVAGLSTTAEDPTDEYGRGSIGLGYPEERDFSAADTFVHELGHAAGRLHAPCGVDDPDYDYPYTDAQIGLWGYDPNEKKLLDPKGKSRDMMSYCTPSWISDYTYRAIFDRLVFLNAQPRALRLGAESWRVVLVEGNTATDQGIVTLPASAGKTRQIERVTASGIERVPARFYPFNHIAGGLWLVPSTADVTSLRIEGRRIQ